jgi:hypothetical protein
MGLGTVKLASAAPRAALRGFNGGALCLDGEAGSDLVHLRNWHRNTMVEAKTMTE